MQNKNKQISNIILAVGSFLLFAGFTSFLFAIREESTLAEYLSAALVLFLGMILMYLYIAFFRKTFHFVAGLSAILSGILFMLFQTNLLPFTLNEGWPLVLLFIAISIFTIGKIKFHRINFSYDFSAFFLLVMSILFSLFSFKIISLSFTQIIYFSIPIMMILAGIFLVFLFIHRQKINDIFKSENLELDDGDIENF